MMTPRWSCRSTNFLVRRPITTWPFRTATSNRIPVNIVEVGPRDGLQNEKAVIPVDVKVDLINRLGLAGICVIEAGSFVSPKWVPQVTFLHNIYRKCAESLTTARQQMAGTADVLTQMDRLPGVRYPVLVPNQKGLDNLLTLLSTNTSTPPLTTDVSVFTGSTDAFTLANTNTTVEASLAALAPVVQKAISHGLRVRGYVSVVITCPYSGRVDPERVREVAKALVDMGCYEVSLGDTVGTGTQTSVREMLDVVGKDIPMEKLAVSFYPFFPAYSDLTGNYRINRYM
jgi:hydroxymethylglutaryl-CoA lyase